MKKSSVPTEDVSGKGEPRVLREKGIEVRVGETQVIIPAHANKGSEAAVFKLQNGDLLVSSHRAEYGTPTMRSRDGGRTWQEATSMISADGGKTWRKGITRSGVELCELGDGEVVSFHGWFGKKTGQNGVYTFPFLRWTDNMAREVEDVAVMNLPTFMAEGPETGPYPNHNMVVLRDGSLLASVQGKFPDDFKESRVFVVRSTDRGKTWDFLALVAFDLSRGRRNEGFDEPGLLILRDGSILCFMRTGGGGGAQRIKPTPIYMSRSIDDGRTWSHADPITEFGVYPNACLAESGIIALCYGRPGNWVTFSPDDGETWVCTFQYSHAPVGMDAGNYNSIAEVEPGKLLALDARTQRDGDGKIEIVGTYLHVRRSTG